MSFIDSCHFCYLVKCNLYLFATVVLLLIWVCNFLYTVPVHYIVIFILIWDEFIKMDNNTRCLKKVYSESSGGIQFSRKNFFLFLSFHFFFPSWSRKYFDFTSIEIVNSITRILDSVLVMHWIIIDFPVKFCSQDWSHVAYLLMRYALLL